MSKGRWVPAPVTTIEKPINRLLAALSEDVLDRLRPNFVSVPATAKRQLHARGERIEHVYFPSGGVASITTTLSRGETAEAATVGQEGMVGVEAIFSDEPVSPGDTMIQVPDSHFLRLPTRAFRAEMARGGAFPDLMGRYAQFVIAQMIQSAACNAIHPIRERCCRWLLMTHDRVDQKDFRLSHEFLAVMLGVRRQSVSVVAGELQGAGLISYRHGVVKVLDRLALEAAACECYETIQHHFRRLMI